MTTSTGHLVKLVELAREKSSDKRRDLLREVSDLFIEDAEARDGEAGEHADEILTRIADEMAESVRAELAERFADAPNPPPGLIRKLAMDAIAVARPVLERSEALSDDDLVCVAHTRGQDHLRAIAARPELSETAADAVVARGDDHTLAALANNAGARLSRNALETLVDRAETAEALQAPLVNRAEMPADLLNEMLFYVGDRLRETILERNEGLDADALDEALKAARARLARRASPTPPDYDEALRMVQSKKLRKQLNGPVLIQYLKEGKQTAFEVALAELTGLDYAAARRVAENPAIDPLAIACRASDFDRDLFVGVAMLRPTRTKRAAFDPEHLREIYDALPRDAAQRAIRFWRLRRDAQTADAQAADAPAA